MKTEHTEQTTQNNKNFYAHEKLTLLTKDNQNNNAQAFIKDIKGTLEHRVLWHCISHYFRYSIDLGIFL